MNSSKNEVSILTTIDCEDLGEELLVPPYPQDTHETVKTCAPSAPTNIDEKPGAPTNTLHAKLQQRESIHAKLQQRESIHAKLQQRESIHDEDGDGENTNHRHSISSLGYAAKSNKRDKDAAMLSTISSVVCQNTQHLKADKEEAMSNKKFKKQKLHPNPPTISTTYYNTVEESFEESKDIDDIFSDLIN